MEGRCASIAIIAIDLGMIYIQVLGNTWIQEFYDVLQSLNKAKSLAEIFTFCLLATAYIAQARLHALFEPIASNPLEKWLTDKYPGKETVVHIPGYMLRAAVI